MLVLGSVGYGCLFYKQQKISELTKDIETQMMMMNPMMMNPMGHESVKDHQPKTNLRFAEKKKNEDSPWKRWFENAIFLGIFESKKNPSLFESLTHDTCTHFSQQQGKKSRHHHRDFHRPHV